MVQSPIPLIALMFAACSSESSSGDGGFRFDAGAIDAADPAQYTGECDDEQQQYVACQTAAQGCGSRECRSGGIDCALATLPVAAQCYAAYGCANFVRRSERLVDCYRGWESCLDTASAPMAIAACDETMRLCLDDAYARWVDENGERPDCNGS